MPQSFNGSDIIQVLLGWFGSLAESLFSAVTGSGGSGFLKTLAVSWKGLLIFFLITGCVLNVVIHFIRWRPHWWWFARKRMLVDDSIFEPKKPRKREEASSLRAVKPSTIVPRRSAGRAQPDLFETDDRDMFKVKKRPR